MKKDIDGILKTFNVDQKREYTIEQAMEALENGGSVRLANGFEFYKARYEGLPVLKLRGLTRTYGEKDRLERAGASFAVTSTLTMDGFYYLPMEVAEKGVKEIIKLYNIPIILMKDSDGNIIESTLGGNVAQEPKAGYQNWDKWKETQDKAEEPRTIYSKPKVDEAGFFSTVETALIKIRQDKALVSQWKAMLLNNGASQVEMDWMGWDELIAMNGEQKYTREEIQGWIDQNRIEVKEVEKSDAVIQTELAMLRQKHDDAKTRIDQIIGDLGGNGTPFITGYPLVWHYKKDGWSVKLPEELIEEVEPLMDAMNDYQEAVEAAEDDYSGKKPANSTKYGQWMTPGGENYKELLLTLPSRHTGLTQKEEEEYTQLVRRASTQGLPSELEGRYYELQKKRNSTPEGEFRTLHWDERNIVAHVRFDGRTALDGSRILFIEEIQSDWAQKGRDVGFKGDIIKKLGKADIFPVNDGTITYFQNGKGQVLNSRGIATINGKEAVKTTEEQQKLIDEVLAKRSLNSVLPDMPFKKTDQWVNLAFRSIMRYAAQNGFDRVGWTRGEMQAERYDLSKQVDHVMYYYNPSSENYSIQISKNERVIQDKTLKEKELANYIGKELAAKIIKGEGEKINSGFFTGNKKLSGFDLKVGGEGMKAFYNSILPSAVNKLVKPFGARVEEVQIRNTDINTFENQPSHTIASIAITPRMRLQFQEGMPLYEPEALYARAGETLAAPIAAETLPEKEPSTVKPLKGTKGETFKKFEELVQLFYPEDGPVDVAYFNYWWRKLRTMAINPLYQKNPKPVKGKSPVKPQTPAYPVRKGDNVYPMAMAIHLEYAREKTRQMILERGETNFRTLRNNYYETDQISNWPYTQTLPRSAEESAGTYPAADDLRGQGDTPDSSDNGNPLLLTDLFDKAKEAIYKKRLLQVDQELDDILGPVGSVDELHDPGAPYDPNNPPPLVTEHMRNVMIRYMPSKRDKRTLRQVAEGMREAYQDNELPVRRLEEEIINRGGEIGDNQQPYRKLNLSKGRLETLHKNFTNERMKPVLEVINEIGYTGMPRELVLPYLICKHAPERNAYIRAREFNKWYEKHKLDYVKWFAANPESTLAEQDAIWDQLEQVNQDTWDSYQKKDYSGIMPMDIGFEFTDDPDGFATTIATEIENALPRQLIDKLWGAIKGVSEQTIDFWEQGRQISRETAQEYRDRYDYFVPLRGWRDGDAESLAYTRGEGFSKSLQYAGGRKSLAENPLAYLQSVAFKAINEMVDFEVKQELFRLVSMNYRGFEDMYRIRKAYYVREINPLTGIEEWELSIDPASLEMVRPDNDLFASGDATTVMYREHMNYKEPRKAREQEVLIHRDAQDGGDVVIVMLNKWIPVAMAINHRNRLYHSLFFQKLQDAKDWDNKAVNALAYMTNAWKANVTSRNVVFAITNFIRDFEEASVTATIRGEKPFKLMGQVLQSFPAAYRGVTGQLDLTQERDRYYDEFSKIGGITGYSHMKSIDQIEKDLAKELKRISRGQTLKGKAQNALPALLHGLEVWSGMFETATRLGVYTRARQMGKSPSQAGMDAKETTINFNRGGKLKKPLDAVFAFAPVGIESLHKNGSLIKRYPKRSAQMILGIVALGLLEAMLNDLTKPETEDGQYYNINEYVRQNYLIIPDLMHLATRGKKGDKYVRLPLPMFFRGFKSLGTILYDVIRGKETAGHAAGRALTNFLWASLSPVDLGGLFVDGKITLSPLAPTITRPFAEIAENRNYMGYRIAREPFTRSQEKAMSDAHLHTRDVNTLVKFFTDALFRAGGGDNETKYYVTKNKLGQVEKNKVSELMDFNPSYLEHVLIGYFGGTAKVGIDAMATIAQLFSAREEVNFKNVPFVNAFLRKIPTHGMNVMSQYYKLKDEIEGNDLLEQAYYKKKDFDKYVMLKSDPYLNEYAAIIEGKDQALGTIMKSMNFQDAEGSERVIDFMEQTIEQIRGVKEKYQRK